MRYQIITDFELASQPTTSEEEMKRLLHFVIVGGGPTGVEFCAELYDFITDDVSKRYPHLRKQISITLYDVAPKLIPMFADSLSGYVKKQFVDRGIHVQTGQAVTRVDKDTFQLKSGDVVPYGLMLWSTGLAPNDLIQSIDLPKDRMKRLFTNENLQVLDKAGIPIQGVYAVGDCATIKGNDLPCTAQVAKQKAEFLVKHFNDVKVADEKFVYKHQGSMAYVGDWKAVVDFGKESSSSPRSGRLGWLIWRTAYMSMAESARNKLKIPIYW